MTGFFTAAEIADVLGGRWLVPPSDQGVVPAGVSIDSRDDVTRRVFFAVSGERHDGHTFVEEAAKAGALMCVVERDVEISTTQCGVLHVPDTRHALAELARAWRSRLKQPHVIGITGSVGKTTTKTILDAVLGSTLRGTCAASSFNNEIGVPLTLLAAQPDDDYIICEIGTNAPGEIRQLASIVAPDIAVITAIGRSHLEGLGSIEGVRAEKASILECLRADGLAILPEWEPELHVAAAGHRMVLFGEGPAADPRLTSRGIESVGQWFEVNGRHRFTLPLPGRHNAMNAMIAIAIARRLGVDDDSIRHALEHMTPPPMRFERTSAGAIEIVNDSYNANPESVRAAIETFVESTSASNDRIVILGDMLELGTQAEPLHEGIGAFVREVVQSAHGGLARAILVGSFAHAVFRGMEDALPPHAVQVFPRLADTDAALIAESIPDGASVLVKGSRGMRLERIVDALRARKEQTATVGQN